MEKSIKNLLNKWVKDDNMIVTERLYYYTSYLLIAFTQVTFNMLSRELNVQPNEGKK